MRGRRQRRGRPAVLRRRAAGGEGVLGDGAAGGEVQRWRDDTATPEQAWWKGSQRGANPQAGRADQSKRRRELAGPSAKPCWKPRIAREQ